MPRAIVIVVIDCLRADHCSAYGYQRETTPTLQALAERGVLFSNAHATSSWTKPSVTSILTGLYPSEHGAFQGVKRSRGRLSTDAIHPRCETLAQRLSAAGWRCGAFMNNAQLGEFSGLQRGFDRYRPTAGKADAILAEFEDWLRPATGPTFTYLHFLEAHWPYKPRRRHMQLFGGDRDTNKFRDYSARDFGRLRRAISHGEAELSDADLEQMMQMYDAAVRRLDGKLKLLFSILERAGIADETALFVTADHGEEFLDHGRIGHGQSLHTELTHVPLVAAIPGGACGQRVSRPVSLVDLAGTVESLAGLEPPAGRPNLLDPHATPRPVVSELRIRDRCWDSLRNEGWALYRQWRAQGGTQPTEPQTELYELAGDPTEQINCAEDPSCARKRAELEDRVTRWRARLHPVGAETSDVEIDEQVVEQLRALGYV